MPNIYSPAITKKISNLGYFYLSKRSQTWHVNHITPPIPTKKFDWQAYHDDYDGAPDANDDRALWAPTLEQLLVDIESYEEEYEAENE